MKAFIIAVCCLLAAPIVCRAESMVIGKVNTQELNELAMENILALEENRECGEKIFEIDKKLQQVQRQMQGVKDEAKLKEMQGELNDLYNEKNRIERKLQTQIKALIIKTAREIGRGRFILILDEEYDSSILYKGADIVDITVDVRDALMGIKE